MKRLIFLLTLFFPCISFAQVGCAPSTSHTDLDIGNVRARINFDGEMWWDNAGSSKYEVPKGSGKTSLYMGAIWVGGKDQGGNLKMAVQTYRQSGTDFWPGPIDTTSISIDSARCHYYDTAWTVTRQEVANFINGAPPTQTMINWPGNGNPAFNETHTLAPFYDRAGDGIYDINDGDYPYYEFGNQSPNIYGRLNGDQTVWWVFNDVGNVHGESGSLLPIGIEIQAQAYAFCTTDSDLMNTTFYSYRIINRSQISLYEASIGNWIDVDLGYYNDDFVGCDVGRKMGYAYNGDSIDDLPYGYGAQLPAIGIDILRGPLANSNDGIDNDFDSLIDEGGETIDLSSFMYYNNDFTVTGNPSQIGHYYNYMHNTWKDGLMLTYGGNGYDPLSTDTARFMFDGNSDPNHYGTNGVDYGFHWSERQTDSAGNPNSPGDRRFIMGSGVFTMAPGSVTHFTTAVVWVQKNGGLDTSVYALKIADDRIQNFFDNNFNNIPTCVVTIGINEFEKISNSIYPNPASDKIFFGNDVNLENKKLSFYTTDGKLFKRFEKIPSSISVADWTTANYFYKIYDEKNSRSGKITIIH